MDGSGHHPLGGGRSPRVAGDTALGVVVLSGTLDATSHDAVRAAPTEALAAVLSRSDPAASAPGGSLRDFGGPILDGGGHPAVEVVVDMREVRLIDAGTIRVLLQAWQKAADAGRALRITGASGAVRQAIEATGADRRLLTQPADHRRAALPDDRRAASPDHRRAASPDPADVDDHRRAAQERQRAEDEGARIVADVQQQVIDLEVRTTRRRLLADLRGRLRTNPRALADAQFLTVADAPTVLDGIIAAATITGAADACDLQFHDPATAALRLVRQRGLSTEFLTYLDTTSRGWPTAALAASTGRPVLVDDVTTSPVFADPPILDILLAAGTRAVHSYPLHDETGHLLAVLSFHHRTTSPRTGDPQLVAWCAARALSRLR